MVGRAEDDEHLRGTCGERGGRRAVTEAAPARLDVRCEHRRDRPRDRLDARLALPRLEVRRQRAPASARVALPHVDWPGGAGARYARSAAARAASSRAPSRRQRVLEPLEDAVEGLVGADVTEDHSAWIPARSCSPSRR